MEGCLFSDGKWVYKVYLDLKGGVQQLITFVAEGWGCICGDGYILGKVLIIAEDRSLLIY